MRQLVAILFSDMVGYSRQIDQDETGALARLEEHNHIMKAAVTRHEGTVIKTVGDAFMVSFPSGVVAVECALDVQRGFELYNATVGESERIQVRIGVHSGDVVLRDGDLFGEAVNVAARLEPLAPAGGVAISRTIFEQIRHKVRATIEDGGMVQLKNIADPMQVFFLRPGEDPVTLQFKIPARRTRPGGKSSRRSALMALGGAAAAAVVTPAVVAGWRRFSGGPREGGTLRVAMGFDAGKFSLYSPVYSRSHLAMQLIFDTLLEPGPNGTALPGVVARWNWFDSPGKGRIELQLRPDVWFHDHPLFPGGTGRRADTKDLAFSLELAKEQGRFPLPVESVVAGEERVTLVLGGPAPLVDIVLQDLLLLPRELKDGGEKLEDMRRPVGTGPFQLAETPHSGTLELVRAPHQWLSKPYLEKVHIFDGQDVSGTMTAMRAGEVDLFDLPNASWEDVVDLSSLRPRLSAAWQGVGADVAKESTSSAITLLMLLVSPRSTVLADPLIRQAIAVAVDRRAIVAATAGRVDKPFGRFLPPGVLGSDPLLPELGHDPARARMLLEKAGHPAGAGIAEFLVVTFAKSKPVAEVLASQLLPFGLRMRIAVGTETSIDGLMAGDADAVLIIDSFGLHGSESPEILCEWQMHGPHSDRLVAVGSEITETMARPDREAIYQKGERFLLEDLPAIPLGLRNPDRPNRLFVVRPEVRGFFDAVTGFARTDKFRRVWLAPR